MAMYAPHVDNETINRTWPSKTITTAPRWCSVDLRDGNQALAEPMDLEKKIRFFKMLVSMGFKEIEISFPSSSDTEYNLTRCLIEEHMIPKDVTIQVLTQARSHLIERTMQALSGVHRAIVHLYISTSPVQRSVVLRMKDAEIIRTAVECTKQIRRLADSTDSEITLQFSPESFSQTELWFARDICDAVTDAWNPAQNGKVIINLPSTVEVATPNIFADQVQWMNDNLAYREDTILCVHTHNDRGTAVAAAELAMLAGAERVEGTLFGNGERTGNADLLTLGLNLYVQGIEPGIALQKIGECIQTYTTCTGMDIHPRHPYVGELVFTAFSGSHQDAISKGLADHEKHGGVWRVPYLPLDPSDIGRSYEAVIRITSQSGQGGAAYILEKKYGFNLPRNLKREFGTLVKKMADRAGKELYPEEIGACFEQEHLEHTFPFGVQRFDCTEQHPDGLVIVRATMTDGDTLHQVTGEGNGPVDAFVRGLASIGIVIEVLSYAEHSLGTGADAQAAAYAEIKTDSRSCFGVGIDTDITYAGVKAVVCALNRRVNINQKSCGQ